MKQTRPQGSLGIINDGERKPWKTVKAGISKYVEDFNKFNMKRGSPSEE